jgi:uncharacterized membrane protein
MQKNIKEHITYWSGMMFVSSFSVLLSLLFISLATPYRLVKTLIIVVLDAIDIVVGAVNKYTSVFDEQLTAQKNQNLAKKTNKEKTKLSDSFPSDN